MKMHAIMQTIVNPFTGPYYVTVAAGIYRAHFKVKTTCRVSESPGLVIAMRTGFSFSGFIILQHI
jgi:hypothetical protein